MIKRIEPSIFYINYDQEGVTKEDLELAGYTMPGYYYMDESYGMYGPYSSLEEVRVKFREYVRLFL